MIRARITDIVEARTVRARNVEAQLRAASEFETWRPTPSQSENDLTARTRQPVLIKQWDLSPIDESSFDPFDPFEPPGRPLPPAAPANITPPAIISLGGRGRRCLGWAARRLVRIAAPDDRPSVDGRRRGYHRRGRAWLYACRRRSRLHDRPRGHRHECQRQRERRGRAGRAGHRAGPVTSRKFKRTVRRTPKPTMQESVGSRARGPIASDCGLTELTRQPGRPREAWPRDRPGSLIAAAMPIGSPLTAASFRRAELPSLTPEAFSGPPLALPTP
jgi:hypothetical protein